MVKIPGIDPTSGSSVQINQVSIDSPSVVNNKFASRQMINDTLGNIFDQAGNEYQKKLEKTQRAERLMTVTSENVQTQSVAIGLQEQAKTLPPDEQVAFVAKGMEERNTFLKEKYGNDLELYAPIYQDAATASLSAQHNAFNYSQQKKKEDRIGVHTEMGIQLSSQFVGMNSVQQQKAIADYSASTDALAEAGDITPEKAAESKAAFAASGYGAVVADLVNRGETRAAGAALNSYKGFFSADEQVRYGERIRNEQERQVRAYEAQLVKEQNRLLKEQQLMLNDPMAYGIQKGEVDPNDWTSRNRFGKGNTVLTKTEIKVMNQQFQMDAPAFIESLAQQWPQIAASGNAQAMLNDLTKDEGGIPPGLGYAVNLFNVGDAQNIKAFSEDLKNVKTINDGYKLISTPGKINDALTADVGYQQVTQAMIDQGIPQPVIQSTVAGIQLRAKSLMVGGVTDPAEAVKLATAPLYEGQAFAQIDGARFSMDKGTDTVAVTGALNRAKNEIKQRSKDFYFTDQNGKEKEVDFENVQWRQYQDKAVLTLEGNRNVVVRDRKNGLPALIDLKKAENMGLEMRRNVDPASIIGSY